jgi:glyoxylase-like metal-dependent hydrolase (beta-lactamase superfamily II)
MRIGDIRIDAVVDGECSSARTRLYLDPGPWARSDWAYFPGNFDPVAGEVLMSVGAFLIRSGDRIVLNDAGFGPRAHGSFTTGGLRSALLALGVAPEDVTDVIYSHLHVDHVGWTTLNGVPFFPNATLWVDRREWNHYTSPEYVMAEWEESLLSDTLGSIATHFAPVGDRVRAFDPDTEILPGIRALDAAGHSPGSTVFELVSGGETGLLLGDLVHTVGELLYGWELGFHHDAEAAVDMVARFRARLVEEGLPFAASHFPGMRWGRLTRVADGAVTYESLI